MPLTWELFPFTIDEGRGSVGSSTVADAIFAVVPNATSLLLMILSDGCLLTGDWGETDSNGDFGEMSSSTYMH